MTIEGTDEFGAAHRSEIALEKDLNSVTAGAVGFSIEDGKAIMGHLQQVIVKQQCESYVVARRFCMDCEHFRRIKDYSERKIRTVFGCVEVLNPRILNCQRCVPYFRAASAVLQDFCPDQATPEVMELSPRLGSLMPDCKAADVIAEFLPVKSTESFATVRHRTLALGKRLDEKARDRAWFDPPHAGEREQIELDLSNDPEREFVVSIDTAHIKSASEADGRTFEIAVARCGRGLRGSRPGHYFVTADTSKQELRLRTLQALQSEGYERRGEVTMLSDGAEIMKRLPRNLPRPTKHTVDWFHVAMKIQPLQQVADHIVRWRKEWTNETIVLDEEIRALKWKLWNGQVNRAIEHRRETIADMSMLREQVDLCAGRIWQLAQPLLTYIRQNKSAVVDYGARYRSGRRIATALAESAVNSLTARRMVKKQQMRWSRRGAHLMLQVRAAVMNGNLLEQLSYEPAIFKSRFDWLFKPTPPLLRAA
ncbi:MAG: ISKra4 family transposase [Hyphomicrobiales bacterium]|nr:ISKra4 family transposase [Hyphomicrobiales bacterium]